MRAFDPVHWLRSNAFPRRGAGRAARIGAEVELLSLDAETGEPAAVTARLLPMLCAWAAERGGRRANGTKGGIRIGLPDGAAFCIEPGGQLELASAPGTSPGALVRALEDILIPLTATAADHGIDLVGAGIDPVNEPGAAPLQIVADRYCRMDAYFESIGPAGRRMMRQTAAVQVNVDPAGPAEIAWHALNAAAPCLTALLANSRRYAGRDTGCASFRAETWRHADPARTGLLTRLDDPAAGYAEFALDAPVMHRAHDGRYPRFRALLHAGQADEAVWADHLTTLFPEVRPKRYLEVRSMDAQPVGDLRLPVLMVAGLTLDPIATREAADLLGPPDPARLVTAGRAGLADPRLAADAADLVDIALRGCARLGRERVPGDDIAIARELADARLRTAPRPARRAAVSFGSTPEAWAARQR